MVSHCLKVDFIISSQNNTLVDPNNHSFSKLLISFDLRSFSFQATFIFDFLVPLAADLFLRRLSNFQWRAYVTMASTALEHEDFMRDAAFNEILHGKSAKARGGLTAMCGKDAAAHKAAMDEYFKHWGNKAYEAETADVREVGYSVA